VLLLITRKDLLEAIEKCQGQKNPNAHTCIKLAAYYTVLDHMLETDYSYANKHSSEYLDVVYSKNSEDVMFVMNELMNEIQAVNPKLYNATIEKLNSL
jgi:hypothetical protein